MHTNIEKHQWVWIIVQDPGTNEKILGQIDHLTQTAFIPTFFTKEDALKCYHHFTKKSEFKYEMQAIIYEDLISHAKKTDFLLFFINGSGEIVDKITPH